MFRITASPAALSLLLLALSGCGGGGAGSAETAAPVEVESVIFGSTAAGARGASSSLAMRERAPTSTDERTRSGLYASADELADEELFAKPVTAVVDADTLGSADATRRYAEELRAFQDATGQSGIAYYVRGADAVAAAAVANALVDAGLDPVFLVR